MWSALAVEVMPENLDTTMVIAVPGPDSATVFRRDIRLRFEDAVSDSAKQAFIEREGMTVLGVRVSDGVFFVRIPDPGPSVDSLYAALRRLRTLPEVRNAVSIRASGLVRDQSGRYPDEGSGMRRSSWLSASRSTWAHRAVRAPEAWGCEQGTYGGAPVGVAVLDWAHQVQRPDYVTFAHVLMGTAQLSALSGKDGGHRSENGG